MAGHTAPMMVIRSAGKSISALLSASRNLEGLGLRSGSRFGFRVSGSSQGQGQGQGRGQGQSGVQRFIEPARMRRKATKRRANPLHDKGEACDRPSVHQGLIRLFRIPF